MERRSKFNTPVERNEDIQRLREEGFGIELRGMNLFLGGVQYLNKEGEVKTGILVTNLKVCGTKTVRPDKHYCYFIGERPCDRNGKAIHHGFSPSGKGGDKKVIGGQKVDFMVSRKPPNGYGDYYEKMMTYVRLISDPVWSLNQRDASTTDC